MQRLLSRALIVSALFLAAVGALAAESEEGRLLQRVRRLTFDGLRAGEGYFSPDGKRMVFQSERDPENPFYQIYMLDMESGEVELVSAGHGKTTCAFIRPGSGEVLFASTHHDPSSQRLQREELEFRASGKQRRYSWDYDPMMDLFVRLADGSLQRLTDAEGYDAEASYSPDGKWIVFTSMRSAYDHELDERQRQRRDTDVSYFGEIYVMPAAGGEPRRLTKTPGYDGGPFFFPDGSRIIWRRFDESGLVADVWSMKPDGSEAERLTDFGAMSWAPFVHPSGEYVFFASNKLGFSNFEIYIVDVEGRREPVRVTYSDGFDGLPVPTPDGRELTWTSTRHGGDGGQIYIAGWNHEAALQALRDAPLRRENGVK